MHLKKTAARLNESDASYKKINLQKCHADDKLIQFNALTARFTRLIDMLINKIFRSIDAVEMVTEVGSIIDIINRAEKRDLISSAQDFRALKDLRNQIAHEYVEENLLMLQEEIFKVIPVLIDSTERTIAYAKKLEKSLENRS